LPFSCICCLSDLQVVSLHTSSHKHEGPRGAKESDLEKEFEHYSELFTLTPDRLKTITKKFVGVLETGLKEDNQTVVSTHLERSNM
jgi:hexokinase